MKRQRSYRWILLSLASVLGLYVGVYLFFRSTESSVIEIGSDKLRMIDFSRDLNAGRMTTAGKTLTWIYTPMMEIDQRLTGELVFAYSDVWEKAPF